LAFGLTDTDDAIIERDAGRPVEIIFPDQQGMGTLFIPNALCVMRGTAHPEAAHQLIEYLLRPEVERRLANGPSAQFPVNPKIAELPRVAPQENVQWMEVDFAAAANAWDSAATFLRSEFSTADDE
jgi:iron(III) transport system substrate-binding protein